MVKAAKAGSVVIVEYKPYTPAETTERENATDFPTEGDGEEQEFVVNKRMLNICIYIHHIPVPVAP